MIWSGLRSMLGLGVTHGVRVRVKGLDSCWRLKYRADMLSALWITHFDFEWDSVSLVLALTFSFCLGLASRGLGYLQGWSNEQRNGIKSEERMIEFGTANRQNNVSLDDEISPEGIMTVS